MGRDYKDIVRELWDKIPPAYDNAVEQYEEAVSAYEEFAEGIEGMLGELFGGFMFDIMEEKLERQLELAEYKLSRYEEMMDVLTGGDFLAIVYAYFDGLFEYSADDF